MSKKKQGSPLTGHFLTFGGRLYDSYKSMEKNFDEDGRELIRKKAKEMGDFIWLKSKMMIRPKDSKLYPYYMHGRLPGHTTEDQMRYLSETRNMSVDEKVQWLDSQGYPRYGRKAGQANTKR